MIKKLFHYLIIKHSDLFDKEYYLKKYPDVRKSDIDPIWHFIKYGWKENRDPSRKFSTSKYLRIYEDVKESNINPLIHFIIHGRKENRFSFSTIKSGSNSTKSNVRLKENNFVSIKNLLQIKIGSKKIFSSINVKLECLLQKFGFRNFKNDPLISVAIPIFDRTELLIESIESILNQSFRDFELLLICDGSPESTLKIVDYYENSYPNVRSFKFKNNSGNAVRGRNKAIKEAKGKYLAFQDSDDVAVRDRLKLSYQEIIKNGADVVYGGWRAIVDGTREIGITNNQEFYSPNCDLEMLKKICVPCQSTVLAKTSALREVGGLNPKMKYREDNELWLRLAYNGYKFSAIKKILTNLRIHKNNLEIKYKEQDDFWYELMIKEYKKRIHMKPKIGYVIPGTEISGGIIVICEHANRLINRGYDVSLISQNNKTDISWFPHLISNVIPINEIAENYDVLVATGWQTASTVQDLPALRKYYFIQSDESRFHNKDTHEYYASLATYEMDFDYLVIAKWMKEWLKKDFDKDSIYVPNAINKTIIHQTAPLEEKGSKLRILIEGPIDIPYKGVENAFMAVRGLDCEVWCVSNSGKPKEDWKCDKFFYKVPFFKMKYIYSSCDVLLKMSTVEGFPLPPLEMMSCGGTVVINEVTGIEEYAKNYFNSIIVEQGDIFGARKAIVELIKDPTLLNELKRNAKKTSENFNWDNTIDILAKAYDQYYSPK